MFSSRKKTKFWFKNWPRWPAFRYIYRLSRSKCFWKKRVPPPIIGWRPPPGNPCRGLPFRQSKLQIGEGLHQKGAEILASLGLSFPLVIHPGSGSPLKNAPLTFFRNAAERAGAESQKQVLVVWGEAEEKNLKEIQEAFRGLDHVRLLLEPLPLKLLAAVFSQSAAYLGNDSGVTQLAAACGLRTFAVFNSTDARVWAPQANAIILSMLKGNLH